jgi:Fe2+ transport system protein B
VGAVAGVAAPQLTGAGEPSRAPLDPRFAVDAEDLDAVGRRPRQRAPAVGRAFLTRPRWREVRREAEGTLAHATVRALPIFLAIIVAASVLSATGVLDLAARGLGPLLAPLRLPADVALPVVLATVRKDGVLLLSEPAIVAALDEAQLLAALLLAGALLPCLVTSLTIARERGRRAAVRLLGRQAIVAILLAGVVSWLGPAVLA